MKLIPFACLATLLCSVSLPIWCMDETQSGTPPEWRLTTPGGIDYREDTAAPHALFATLEGGSEMGTSFFAVKNPVNGTYTCSFDTMYYAQKLEPDALWIKARNKAAALRALDAGGSLENDPEVRIIGIGDRPVSPVIDWDAAPEPLTPALSRAASAASALSRALTQKTGTPVSLSRAASQQLALSRAGSRNGAQPLSRTATQQSRPSRTSSKHPSRVDTPAVSEKELAQALSRKSTTLSQATTVAFQSQPSSQELE